MSVFRRNIDRLYLLDSACHNGKVYKTLAALIIRNSSEAVSMKRLVNNVLRKTIGYELNDVSRVRDSRNGWEQYRFIKPDGSAKKQVHH